MYLGYVSPIKKNPTLFGSGVTSRRRKRCKEGLERKPRVLLPFFAIALDAALLAMDTFSGAARPRSIAGGDDKGDDFIAPQG
jgi:hypothetical protein